MTRAQEGGSAILTRHGCNLSICFQKAAHGVREGRGCGTVSGDELLVGSIVCLIDRNSKIYT